MYIQVQEPILYVLAAIFIIYNVYTLSEYLRSGQSVRAWWNNQRMSRINTTNAWLFGFFSVIFKLLGISETVFEVTQKDQSSDDASDAEAGRFTFNESPIFLPGTTILVVHLTALVVSLLKLKPPARDGHGSGLGEVLCSVYLVLCFWPFLKGLFGKGRHGIPSSTICKSTALALLFVYFCRRATIGWDFGHEIIFFAHNDWGFGHEIMMFLTVGSNSNLENQNLYEFLMWEILWFKRLNLPYVGAHVLTCSPSIPTPPPKDYRIFFFFMLSNKV